ncbi:MAG: hypothetical protein AB1690_09550 [Candidatus Zixiibacteriota bacterium]|jgi:GTPase SAR1 family protein
MRPGSILKIFKKGSKFAAKQKGKKGEPGYGWPPGIRIGVYGHANSGKTVYFTVLNEESKIAKDLQISVIDNATAGEFLANYRAIWGVGAATDVGTVVDRRGDKKFPDPTAGDRLLKFNAIIDKNKKVSVVTYDYNGRAVAISDRIELKEKVLDFMDGCSGILFFFDPKTLAAELQSQEHVASFVSMLERLAPLKSRLPMPIALVVTKADILPGFTGDNQIVLINPEDENFLAEDFETFLDRVLSSNRIASNSAWAGSVRNVLFKLREFLNVVVGRTLDFQIFFISNTGQTPEKIGTEVGRSIYVPPAKIHPIGVKEPFYWLLKSIFRSRKVSRFRAVAKFVMLLSLLWIVLYSIPNLYHFKMLLPGLESKEKVVLAATNGSVLGLNTDQRQEIIDQYRKYERSWTVNYLFPNFKYPSSEIREAYTAFNMGMAVKTLDSALRDFASVVRDPSMWPVFNLTDSTIRYQPIHDKILEQLNRYRQSTDYTELYKRSNRGKQLWDNFEKAIKNPTDSTPWLAIAQQVQIFQTDFGHELSSAEKDLLKAFSTRKAKKEQAVVAQKITSEMGSFVEQINSVTDPAFRFETALTQLRQILANLDPVVDRQNVTMINKYLQDAAKWSQRRKFTCKIESVPGKAHLHIEVTEKGKDPKWSEVNQIFEGDKIEFFWKIGDDIHIAIDTAKHVCQLGKDPSDRKPLKGKYSIFEMNGEINFGNIGKKIIISFAPPLEEQIPKLEP